MEHPAISSAVADRVRLGFEVAFFLPGYFKRHRDDVRSLFETWLETTTPETAFVGAKTSTKELKWSAKTKARALQELSVAAGAKAGYLRVVSGDDAFFVNGMVTDAIDIEDGDTNSVHISLPWATTPERLESLMRSMITTLPEAVSGFCTPRVFFHDLNTGDGASREAARLCVRYPGLEIGVRSGPLDGVCHGPFWLTYVSTQLGLDERQAPQPCERIGRGMLLRSSSAPELGSVHDPDFLPGLRRMAAYLAPITAPIPESPVKATARRIITLNNDGRGPRFDAFQRELGVAWCERFVTPNDRLAKLSEQLEHMLQLETTIDDSPRDDDARPR